MKGNTTIDFLSLITLGAAKSVAEEILNQNKAGGLESVSVKQVSGSYYLVFKVKNSGTFETPLPGLLTPQQQNYIINMMNKLIDDNNKLKFNGNEVLDTSNFVEEFLKHCNRDVIIQENNLITVKSSTLIDDARISEDQTYSSKKIDNDFAKNADVLKKDNAEVYTPSGDYMPATKKYVDDMIKSLNNMHIIGRVDKVEDLPVDAEEQDVWYVGLEGAASFETWVKLQDGNWLQIGTTDIKFDNYYDKDAINALLKKKISVLETLPSPSENNLSEVVLSLSDKCIYRCLVINSDFSEEKLYAWSLIVDLTKLGSGGSDIKGSTINGNILVDGEEVTVYDEIDVMKKSFYASEINEGSVKQADVAKGIEAVEESTEVNAFYGRNSTGVVGVYPIPMGVKDESMLLHYEFFNVTPGLEKDIESIVQLNDKAIIAIDRLVNEDTDIDVSIKNISKNNASTLNKTENILIEDDGVSIKKEYMEASITNADGFNEIDLSSYSNGIIIECEVND